MTAPPPQPNSLPTWVRSYIHYDNLTKNYSQQAAGARKLRDNFEKQIIQNLRNNNMTDAVIQVTGATLQCVDEKTCPSMTMPRLEEYLHKYFSQKGNGIDETEAILRYIRLQKQNDTSIITHLKKTPLAAPIPPPPSGQAALPH